MLCKNCEESAFYFNKVKLAYAGNDALVSDTAVAGKIVSAYTQPGQLHIPTLTEVLKNIPGFLPPPEIDYLMVVECK